MHCTRRMTKDFIWVGADDRRLAMFEGIYPVPEGVSYNSYLLLDEKTVLLDTVDKAVEKQFLENIEYSLKGRTLDYLIVHHMEPDHSATIKTLLLLYPNITIVCNKKTKDMIHQFFGETLSFQTKLVEEGDCLQVGTHEFTFFMAPMVHWPEVMVSYEKSEHILFSADAFGTFGALNGALFADEVDFFGMYLGKARRYYTNIVGKYGMQVQALLRKASGLEITILCPLHGFVWRADIGAYIAKYKQWSDYEPELQGVMIAYASVYGNTENVANIVACKLCERGIPVTMFDVSVTHLSDIVSASFQYSHLVFASITYNNGIFTPMDTLLRELVAHNLQHRTIALIENGSWSMMSRKKMKEIIEELKNVTLLEETISIKSALTEQHMIQIDKLVEHIVREIE